MTPSALHLFCGLGGGALGFQRAGFSSVGAFDNDPEACADHEYLTGEPATCVDLATMSPQDLRGACTGRPDVVFSSPPCRSFSACLPAAKAKTAKYLDLSSLALRSIWLVLEAWPTPPPLILLENVPRIKSRGKDWLVQMTGLLQSYGYAVQQTTHDCGELGGLAQRRRRFLLIARHMEQVPEFVYEPPKKRVRGIGEVLGVLPVPLPGSTEGGPMHRLPRLSALNWVRLALIPAGRDWRDLPEEVALSPRSGRQNGGFGVNANDKPSHTVVGEGSVRNTWSSVAEVRLTCSPRAGGYGVNSFDAAAPTVVASACHDNGMWSIAEVRVMCERREGGHGVMEWDGVSPPVIAAATIHNWPASVADPSLSYAPRSGTLGMTGWARPSHVVIGTACSNKGANVADERMPVVEGPAIDLASKRPTYLIIRAIDGTWHRPLTTLELAAIQGLPTEVNGEPLKLAGNSHKRWRQRIGNAVPPPAGEAMAKTMMATLIAAAAGTFLMSALPVWADGLDDEGGAQDEHA